MNRMSIRAYHLRDSCELETQKEVKYSALYNDGQFMQELVCILLLRIEA